VIASEPSRSPQQDQEPATLGDLVAGAVSALFGAAVLLHVRSFPELPDGAPGPALFPAILGGLFLLFGLVLVGRYVAQQRRSPAAHPAGDAAASSRGEGYSTRTAWVNALSVLGAIAFYLVASPVLGFSVTTAVMLLALMWRLGAGLRTAVPAALGTTAVMYVLFERALQVPLPAGVLG